MKRRFLSAVLAPTLALLLILPAQAADIGFDDVAPGAWYEEAALYCQETGLMGGTGEGIFAPDTIMTRAMLCTVLHRAAGSPLAEDAAPFPDVPPESWYGPAAAWAAEAGLVNGYEDGLFHPAESVTREQLAAILYRAAGSPAAPAGEDYDDEGDIAPWAETAADWAREAGVLAGAGGFFRPKAAATRAQAAQALMNYTLLPGTRSVMSAIDILCQPRDIVPLEGGGFLVSDSYYKVIWQVKAGISSVYAGDADVLEGPWGPVGGYNDDILTETLFQEPWAMAPFLGGWAVSDPANGAVRLVLPEGAQTLNCSTEEDLPAADMGVAFQRPTGLASDEEGNLYIADTGAGAIRRVTPEGRLDTLADGLAEPMGLCWLGDALYAAETSAHRVVKITPDGAVTPAAGTGEAAYLDGPAEAAALSSPQELAAGPDGTLYIADMGNSAIRSLKDGQVGTLVLRDVASTEEFFPISPLGMMVCGHRLYVCDAFSRKVVTIALG